MFFFRHPRPVVDGRAVAVQVAQKKVSSGTEMHVLVIPDHKADQGDASPPLPPACGSNT
jgi:hypothetical protein